MPQGTVQIANASPLNYTYVNAIIFDGTQQIDTGLYTSGVTETEVTFANFSKSGTYGFVYGGYYDGGRAGGLFCIGNSYDAYVSIGSGEAASISEDIRGGKITFKLKIDTTNYTGRYQWNDHLPIDFNWNGYYNKQPIQIAGMWRSSREQMGAFQLYSFKAWQNDVLVRDMRPAINGYGVVGLHDIVNDTFYTNIWSSTFSYLSPWYLNNNILTNTPMPQTSIDDTFSAPYPSSWWQLSSSSTLYTIMLPEEVTGDVLEPPYPASLWYLDENNLIQNAMLNKYNAPTNWSMPYPISLWWYDNTTVDYNRLRELIVPEEPIIGAYSQCPNLVSVQIPRSVKKIGRYSFADTSLTQVTIARDCTYFSTSFPSGCQINFYDD